MALFMPALNDFVSVTLGGSASGFYTVEDPVSLPILPFIWEGKKVSLKLVLRIFKFFIHNLL